MFRIRHIEIFHAVMQAGTVKGAADTLHITQPAASRLLQQAEQSIGVMLFQRVRGRLVPTIEAQRLFPEVEQLYTQLDAVRRSAANLGPGSETVLRLLCVPGLSIEALPRALGVWNLAHPNVRLMFRTLHSKQIADAIVRREAELGFALEPSNHPAVMDLPVGHGRVVCVGLDLPDEPVTLQALAERPLIDLDPSDPIGRHLHIAYDAHGVTSAARVTTSSYHAAIEMAAQGLGWAVVDSWSALHARRLPGLKVQPLLPEIRTTAYALQSRDLPWSSAADALVERMGQALA
jgi:DNA-binding transcriptional LysR family regulator